MMNNQQLGKYFYQQIEKNHTSDSDAQFQLQEIYRLFNAFVGQVLRQEKMQFNTQFARISYLCHKFDINQKQQWFIQEFRRAARGVLYHQQTYDAKIYQLGVKATCLLVEQITQTPFTKKLKDIVPTDNFYQKSPVKSVKSMPYLRAMVLKVDESKEVIIARAESITDRDVIIKYNKPSINEPFTPTVKAIKYVWKERVMVNLLQVKIDEEGILYPKMIVVEPDFLMDVSSVAYSFTPDGQFPMLYLLKKFLPFQTTVPLMLGNIANFFLDELMYNEDADFKTTFAKVFKLNPMGFTALDDQTIRQIYHKSQRHFLTLKQMVKGGFHQNKIQREDCYLEPTFYSEQYGLQGRLDIFYEDKITPTNSAVVELKSGSAFKPNQYGINISHYQQALMYDMLIKSVYQQRDPRNYILYSKQEIDQLRFAPAIKSLQHEAIQVRNQMMAMEQHLINLKEQKDWDFTILDKLRPSAFMGLSGFSKKDVEFFSGVWSKATALERAYILSFVSFIAKEHQLARIGVEGSDQINGLASLWLSSYVEKNDNFEIISYLTVKPSGNCAQEEEPMVTFIKDEERTNDLANFRMGDIALLYPCQEPEKGGTALDNQLFKCTIIDINKHEVKVRLRSKQFNNSIFDKEGQFWTLEHDMMDHGFSAMYKGLFSFLQYPLPKRQLMLTERAPKEPALEPIPIHQLADAHRMTDEQKTVLQKVIRAEEYFLLWGPPGTGKTSIMLKNLVDYLTRFTDENILLLAYTNRAVDEICEAIESIDDKIKDDYIRIGSRYSTNEKFHDQLLNKKIDTVGKRAELKGIIDNHRIFVATVASITNRKLLLELKQFDRVIIDEASQILEPVLVGLLPLFKRFVLIGDHNQLPAVVAQDEERSATALEPLHNIGLHNLRNSLFERMFLRCKDNGWIWAYDMLSHQGRMHQDIMEFPNRFFYREQLSILPLEVSTHQLDPLNLVAINPENPLENYLANNRFCYLSTKADGDSKTGKTNQYEAKMIGQLVDTYCKLYEANGLEIDHGQTIGIITPYRAQIAAIKQELETYNKGYELFSVDTVERYQGSARDIILISLSLNKVSQLDFLVSLSTNGIVDRKLNVALTRARKQLVLVGNEMLMRQSEVYRNMVDFCEKVKR